ncbi:helix-turn-helix domain-containing protein [Flavobacterium sp. N1994]|uniref:helix-turn-helix domain-containing protein n=1 Tax=Flavobacterium sp. N1994 TaxID=2986827 RepID=UPI002222A8AB|nr:helix-turn-helix transcriptional regulator [Flavobacterium sp. N1994]
MKTTSHSANQLPHMGTFIKNRIDEHNIRYSEIARRMNIHQSTINGYFIQETLQTRTLWKLSHALGYNLFTDLIQQLPEELQQTNKTSFQQQIQEQIQEQQQEIEALKKELAIYKEILNKRI